MSSIFSYIIFLIFYNDFSATSAEGTSIVYADDDTENVHDSDPEELKRKLQSEADRATSWVKDNRMVCSGEKTKLLIMGTSELKENLLYSQNKNIEKNY